MKPKRDILSIVFFAISCALTAVLFLGKFSLLTIISAAINCAAALLFLIKVIAKKPVSPFLPIGYFVSLVGITVFYTVYGVEDTLANLLKNLMLAAPSLALLVVLVIFFYAVKSCRKRMIAGILSLVLIGTSVLYVLTMNLKMTPQVESMQKGHDLYLDFLKESGADADAPNVLFILADDLGYADISSYCYKEGDEAIIETPNIDAIGEEGIMLDCFYSASPVCAPSRFACMTGRYPARGYADNVFFPTEESLYPFVSTRYINPFEFQKGVDGILPDEITVAEGFQSLGYRTGLFGKWHLGDYGQYWPTKNGFDYFYGSPLVNDMTPYEFYRNEEKVISHADMDQSKITSLLTGELTDFISGSVAKNERFFAYYATPWPHYPVAAGEAYLGSSSAGVYGDCVEELDASIGSVVSLLKELDVYDNTLIVFTSDNGPGREGATGALRGRKNTTFEGGQKVPFLCCWADRITPIDAPLSARTMNIDLFPTLLSAAGVDALPSDRIIDGKNLLPLFLGEVAEDEAIHDALYYMKRGKVQAVQMPITFEDGTTTDFKYYPSVRSENAAFIDQVYKNYLFNLDLDPAEAYNTAETYPHAVEILADKFEAFNEDLKSNRRGIKK